MLWPFRRTLGIRSASKCMSHAHGSQEQKRIPKTNGLAPWHKLVCAVAGWRFRAVLIGVERHYMLVGTALRTLLSQLALQLDLTALQLRYRNPCRSVQVVETRRMHNLNRTCSAYVHGARQALIHECQLTFPSTRSSYRGAPQLSNPSTMYDFARML